MAEAGLDKGPATLARLEGVGKRYGGVQALSGVDMDLRAGEIHAIVGENGAGKSTLIKVMSGMVSADEGEVTLGEDVAVSVVHQELAVVPALSVLDNLFLGDPRVRQLYRRRSFRPEAREHLDEVGLGGIDVDVKAGTLTLAEQQLVEIARSIVRRAQITVLDEPTATLSDAEIERIFEVVTKLRARNHAVVYISHRLREIFGLADRVTTLRNGRVVATQEIGELDTDTLVAQMIGAAPERNRSSSVTFPADAGSVPALRITAGSSVDSFAGVSLSVQPGEIVGILGQIGSGADGVVRAAAGIDPDFTGTIEVDGQQVPRIDLAGMRRAGVSYLSESRKDDGLFLDFTTETNVTSGILGEVSRFGWVANSDRKERAGSLLARFTVPTSRMSSPVSQLSGGNQQKVALAKSVASDPAVLLLNEPTRGVDVGARSEIYAQLRGLAADGMAALCFTSDVTEATELCDRVVTMFRGRTVRSVPVDENSEPALLGDILHGGDEA